MILTDVNVLVYAFREDTLDHAAYHRWLEELINGSTTYGMVQSVLSSFLRIVTHPKIFKKPTSIPLALDFINQIKNQPHCIMIAEGEKHWEIFSRLVIELEAKGNLITDAYLAAIAIESGSEWITTDRDYARFTGLKWRHPLKV